MIQVDGRHPCIVEMTRAVPGAVVLFHTHVAHLYRQEILKRRLPDVPVEDVVGDSKRMRAHIPILDDVHPRISDVTAVELEGLRPETTAPPARPSAYGVVEAAT